MRRITTWLVIAVIHTQLAANAVAAEGDTITSTEILSQTINFSCMQWRPVGACLWMTCSPFGCDFDWSVKVRHNLPEAVVSAYPDTGENPWVDVAAYSKPTAIAQDGGSDTEGPTDNHETALRFKNADVIGSPASLIFRALARSGNYCRSGAQAYFPYFLSTLDYNWRDSTIETPWTIANFARGLRTGSGLSYFGPIYPRVGFVMNSHDYKSAALNAQRVADITTRRGQPHIYRSMVWRTEDGWWPPNRPVKEGDRSTHSWQQLVPKGNSRQCVIFPDIDDGKTLHDPYAARLSEQTGYVWHLWRTYRCCKREGAELIYHTGW